MTRYRLFTIPVAVLALSAAATGCGSSTKTPAGAPPAPSTSTPTPTSTSSMTTAASGAGALTAEANAAAAGDIPDNQVFLMFGNAAAGYAIRYPEGWLQRGNGKSVTFQDKNNRIRIVVSSGAAFTAGSVRADIAALKSSNSSFTATTPTPVVLPAGPAFKVSYSTDSAPNPVTNKRVTLAVDRYYISKGGKRAIIDLGAPKGVDNVDAFRMISRSFRWR
jgi:hypothetical protein